MIFSKKLISVKAKNLPAGQAGVDLVCAKSRIFNTEWDQITVNIHGNSDFKWYYIT